MRGLVESRGELTGQGVSLIQCLDIPVKGCMLWARQVLSAACGLCEVKQSYCSNVCAPRLHDGLFGPREDKAGRHCERQRAGSCLCITLVV